MLDELAEPDAELADEVRLLLFTFEDVVKLDDRSIQMVLKEVDQKDLAHRPARRQRRDVKRPDLLQHVRARRRAAPRGDRVPAAAARSVVEEAQGRIVGVVRRLEEAGAIIISRGGGDEDQML